MRKKVNKGTLVDYGRGFFGLKLLKNNIAFLLPAIFFAVS